MPHQLTLDDQLNALRYNTSGIASQLDNITGRLDSILAGANHDAKQRQHHADDNISAIANLQADIRLQTHERGTHHNELLAELEAIRQEIGDQTHLADETARDLAAELRMLRETIAEAAGIWQARGV